jgi:hypothetical protein
MAVFFRRPPPQKVDADRTDDDRGEHEAGNGETNSDSHALLNLRRSADTVS